MNRLILLSSLVVSSSLLAAPKYVRLDFASFGEGINQRLYHQVSEMIEIEKRYSNISDVETFSWGKEGERTICLSSDLRNMSRLEAIFSVLSEDDETTSVQWAHHCGYEDVIIPSCPVLVPPGPGFCPDGIVSTKLDERQCRYFVCND